jgi:hypothetical protein
MPAEFDSMRLLEVPFAETLPDSQIGKAPDSGSGDCRFEPCSGNHQLIPCRARSSSGLGCRILSPVTGVRTPYGLPTHSGGLRAFCCCIKGAAAPTRGSLFSWSKTTTDSIHEYAAEAPGASETPCYSEQSDGPFVGSMPMQGLPNRPRLRNTPNQGSGVSRFTALSL